MSNDIAIEVHGLSKAYRIGLQEKKHETLAGVMASFLKAPFANYRNVRNLSRFRTWARTETSAESSDAEDNPVDVIWALKNISFQVRRGEVLGIIGRNGAGKSTLLKVLSRITEPTRGRAVIYGRVSSLLEIGTGFHPDLTGRENVYLNGTILGMSKKEVDRKFEEIVEFSEVEKFIDTPVKRYSSGMRVRLAFAVAAHLDPEVLIVDEVLAVGDIDFQKKCIGKMSEVAHQGRTVLFVSHNMAALTQLCTRGIVLVDGKIRFDADAGRSVDYYVTSSSETETPDMARNGAAVLENLRVNGSVRPKLQSGTPLEISVALRGDIEGHLLVILVVEDASGSTILHDRWKKKDVTAEALGKGFALRIGVPGLPLRPGMYSIYLKAIFTFNNEPARSTSERLALEIRGDSASIGRALLVPKIDWLQEQFDGFHAPDDAISDSTPVSEQR